MAIGSTLAASDIFPMNWTLLTQKQQNLILEPYSCERKLYEPTSTIQTEGRVVYRKRISKAYYQFSYKYSGIMHWEYLMLETFYRRMHGGYDTFYLVDWSSPYKVLGSATNSLTLDRIDRLESTTGYGGNLILLYNAIPATTNKQLLTISSSETFGNYTIDFNEAISISTSNAFAYIIYPVIFDSTDISPTVNDFCLQRNIITYPGYGDMCIYGPVVDCNIVFLHTGVLKDPS